MNRISKIADKLYKNQLLIACNEVIEGKSKVTSTIIDSETFEIIRNAIPHSLIIKPYIIDEKYNLIIFAKEQIYIDIMEEINDLAISKELREKIYKNLLAEG